jgi:hypothetical protein
VAVALTQRGPAATPPAKLPALQTSRIADANIRQAIDALREWVEVRLGARGDFYERAVTQRELVPLLNLIEARLKALEDADVAAATTAAATADPATLAAFDAFVASSTGADTAMRAEIAELRSRIIALEAP